MIEDRNSNLSGVLNIVCLREVAQKLIYPCMAMFLEQYPHIITNVITKKETSYIIPQIMISPLAMKIQKFSMIGVAQDKPAITVYINIKPIPLKIKAYIDYLANEIRLNFK